MCAAPAEGSLSRKTFSNLRGVRWRIDLGILPRSPSSIEEIRRAAADSRRRYVNWRRRLLVDPHFAKDESRTPDPAVENPLSTNPDSMWGRFFRNAEIEKMLDQDLSRLYPEIGDYFQTDACQSMLRHILLIWCLAHPQYGYRQGMHELLAPLLYVLHVDVEHFSQVQGLHEDHLNDDFDVTSFPQTNLVPDSRLERVPKITASDRKNCLCNLDQLDPDTRDLMLMNDAYGAEGELGVILSEKFMEHDAYCMFDDLMNGASGVVAIADFFSQSPTTESTTGLTPVIEASSALYHLLSSIDPSLHSHLIELGVEPQYFAMRWLRVLFGREFSLENLLIVWDEIFYSSNSPLYPGLASIADHHFRLLCSARGAFILSIGISMLLHLRSSLLASEYSTICLQRMLNFPADVDVRSLLDKAKSLTFLVLDISISSSSSQRRNLISKQSEVEEAWQMLHKADSDYKDAQGSSIINKMRKGLLKEKIRSSFSESDVHDTNSMGQKKDYWSFLRRVILDDPSGADGTSGVSQASAEAGKEGHGEDSTGNTPHMGEAGLDATCPSTTDSLQTVHKCNPGKSNAICESCSSCSDSEMHNNCESSLVANVRTEEGIKRAVNLEGQAAPGDGHQVFGKVVGASGEGNLETENTAKSSVLEELYKEISNLSASHGPSFTGIGETSKVGDGQLLSNLRSLGQSMLDHLQVIESVLQQDLGQVLVDNQSNTFRGKEQSEAMAALNKLRKISNLFCTF